MYLSGQQQPSVAGVDREASKNLIASLEAKRARILDAYFDGTISKPERDKRLAAIDVELAGCNALLAKRVERPAANVTVRQLAALLQVFVGLRFLQREQKRSIMAAARARVFTSGYTIERVEIAVPCTPGDSGSHTGNHFPAADALPPARCAETPAARPETIRRYARATLRRDAE